mmetsp:Transcript_8811/g.54156  ORF Transcript_8811/g.54156 Transcript_8811/m.54156 type:complete len:244 (-) Transcript_8811:393-1124(-)
MNPHVMMCCSYLDGLGEKARDPATTGTGQNRAGAKEMPEGLCQLYADSPSKALMHGNEKCSRAQLMHTAFEPFSLLSSSWVFEARLLHVYPRAMGCDAGQLLLLVQYSGEAWFISLSFLAPSDQRGLSSRISLALVQSSSLFSSVSPRSCWSRSSCLRYEPCASMLSWSCLWVSSCSCSLFCISICFLRASSRCFLCVCCPSGSFLSSASLVVSVRWSCSSTFSSLRLALTLSLYFCRWLLTW